MNMIKQAESLAAARAPLRKTFHFFPVLAHSSLLLLSIFNDPIMANGQRHDK